MSQFRDLSQKVATWICDVFGPNYLWNRRERAMRILEEAVELAQAEGIEWNDLQNVATHVYSKPADDATTEASGVAITLLAWAASTDTDLGQEVEDTLVQLRAREPREYGKKIALKRSKGMVMEDRLTNYEIGLTEGAENLSR